MFIIYVYARIWAKFEPISLIFVIIFIMYFSYYYYSTGFIIYVMYLCASERTFHL